MVSPAQQRIKQIIRPPEVDLLIQPYFVHRQQQDQQTSHTQADRQKDTLRFQLFPAMQQEQDQQDEPRRCAVEQKPPGRVILRIVDRDSTDIDVLSLLRHAYCNLVRGISDVHGGRCKHVIIIIGYLSAL